LLHTIIRITCLIGKAYFKSAAAAVAANGFRKTGLFPCKLHIFSEHEPARIWAQHHELFAWQPCVVYQNCRRTAYHQRHKSTDPNQQSLRLSHKTPLLLSCLWH